MPTEDEFIKEISRFFPPASSDLLVGPGDDTAIIQSPNPPACQVLTTDVCIENQHFYRSHSPLAIGHKILARNISDFAAMAATPRFALITIAIPKDLPVNFASEIIRGISKTADQYDITIAGGETSRSSQEIFISIALFGDVAPERYILRSTAKPEDILLVTGTLGNSIQEKHLTFSPRLQEAHWLAQNFLPTAMMDLSDGLASDLPRLADASNLGFSVNLDALPCSPGATTQMALEDGEDYELLFTISPDQLSPLLTAWKTVFPDLPLTPIGNILASPSTRTPLGSGFDHLKKP